MRKSRCSGTLVAMAFVCLASLGLPCAAQQSAGYRLQEQTFNAGGRPTEGTAAASASYRISLDAIGAAFARSGEVSAASYRMELGFVPIHRPPGETRHLLFDPDKQTLRWDAEPTVGDYMLYRNALTSLNGTNWGACFQPGIFGTSATDGAVPTPGGGFFYLVAARNRLDEHGPLGWASDGSARLPLTDCP